MVLFRSVAWLVKTFVGSPGHHAAHVAKKRIGIAALQAKGAGGAVIARTDVHGGG